MAQEIELGSKVKCKYTGFVGIAVAKIRFINGCVQYEVAPHAQKDGTLRDPIGIDSQSLVVIAQPTTSKTDVRKKEKASTGGRSTRCHSMVGH